MNCATSYNFCEQYILCLAWGRQVPREGSVAGMWHKARSCCTLSACFHLLRCRRWPNRAQNRTPALIDVFVLHLYWILYTWIHIRIYLFIYLNKSIGSGKSYANCKTSTKASRRIRSINRMYVSFRRHTAASIVPRFSACVICSASD